MHPSGRKTERASVKGGISKPRRPPRGNHGKESQPNSARKAAGDDRGDYDLMMNAEATQASNSQRGAAEAEAKFHGKTRRQGNPGQPT